MRKEADELSAAVVTRSILLSEDFTGNLEEELCAYLNNLIDEELKKGDKTDFDLIDEYAEAINFIRENGTADILPVISDREFTDKLGMKNKSAVPKIAAAAAVIIAVIGINSAVSQEINVNLIEKGAMYIKDLFNPQSVSEEQTETTVPPTEEKTAAPEIITSIELDYDENFRTEYYVGENFDRRGLNVYLITQNGKTRTDKYEIITESPFAQKAGEQAVTITAEGFSKSFTVRIINSEKTPVLNSIYATFPDGFDFTYRGEPDLSGMRVYAVYSDGDERELTKDEYTLTVDESKNPFVKTAAVKVEYCGCTSEFVMKGVLK